mmetsp:Transcript_99184/g.265240  ORF Transcript_99184/g.265240 Transcript_99184/m.265240 type:complete len:205 (+) Transcript_99184:3096-3710(+)
MGFILQVLQQRCLCCLRCFRIVTSESHTQRHQRLFHHGAAAVPQQRNQCSKNPLLRKLRLSLGQPRVLRHFSRQERLPILIVVPRDAAQIPSHRSHTVENECGGTRRASGLLSQHRRQVGQGGEIVVDDGDEILQPVPDSLGRIHVQRSCNLVVEPCEPLLELLSRDLLLRLDRLACFQVSNPIRHILNHLGRDLSHLCHLLHL